MEEADTSVNLTQPSMEGSDLDASGDATCSFVLPRKKKKKMSLKKKKMAVSMNSSLAYQSYNASVMKATMRANNRALARALEDKKHQLGSAQRTILALQQFEQSLHSEIRTLQRDNELRDAEIANKNVQLSQINNVLLCLVQAQQTTLQQLEKALLLSKHSPPRNNSGLAVTRTDSQLPAQIPSQDDSPSPAAFRAAVLAAGGPRRVRVLTKKRKSTSPEKTVPVQAAGPSKPPSPEQPVIKRPPPVVHSPPTARAPPAPAPSKSGPHLVMAEPSVPFISHVPDLSMVVEQSYLQDMSILPMATIPYSPPIPTHRPVVPVTTEIDECSRGRSRTEVEKIDGGQDRAKRRDRSRSRRRSVLIYKAGNEIEEESNGIGRRVRMRSRSRSLAREQCEPVAAEVDFDEDDMTTTIVSGHFAEPFEPLIPDKDNGRSPPVTEAVREPKESAAKSLKSQTQASPPITVNSNSKVDADLFIPKFIYLDADSKSGSRGCTPSSRDPTPILSSSKSKKAKVQREEPNKKSATVKSSAEEMQSPGEKVTDIDPQGTPVQHDKEKPEKAKKRLVDVKRRDVEVTQAAEGPMAVNEEEPIGNSSTVQLNVESPMKMDKVEPEKVRKPMRRERRGTVTLEGNTVESEIESVRSTTDRMPTSPVRADPVETKEAKKKQAPKDNKHSNEMSDSVESESQSPKVDTKKVQKSVAKEHRSTTVVPHKDVVKTHLETASAMEQNQVQPGKAKKRITRERRGTVTLQKDAVEETLSEKSTDLEIESTIAQDKVQPEKVKKRVTRERRGTVTLQKDAVEETYPQKSTDLESDCDMEQVKGQVEKNTKRLTKERKDSTATPVSTVDTVEHTDQPTRDSSTKFSALLPDDNDIDCDPGVGFSRSERRGTFCVSKKREASKVVAMDKQDDIWGECDDILVSGDFGDSDITMISDTLNMTDDETRIYSLPVRKDTIVEKKVVEIEVEIDHSNNIEESNCNADEMKIKLKKTGKETEHHTKKNTFDEKKIDIEHSDGDDMKIKSKKLAKEIERHAKKGTGEKQNGKNDIVEKKVKGGIKKPQANETEGMQTGEESRAKGKKSQISASGEPGKRKLPREEDDEDLYMDAICDAMEAKAAKRPVQNSDRHEKFGFGKEHPDGRVVSRKKFKPIGSSTDSDSGKGSHNSDGEEVLKKKFSVFQSKPGSYKFLAGRKDIGTIMQQQSNDTRKKPRSKNAKPSATSMLPKAKSATRSKTRAKPADSGSLMGPPALMPPSKPKEKSVFDLSNMSLSESVMQAKDKNYSEYVGRELDKPQAPPGTYDDDGNKITESPHGIMLQLTNYRRTKPRSKCKNVTYAVQLAEEHSCVIPTTSPTTPVKGADSDQKRTSTAGHTPSKVSNKKVQSEGAAVRKTQSATRVTSSSLLSSDEDTFAKREDRAQQAACVTVIPESPMPPGSPSPVIAKSKIKNKKCAAVFSSSDEEDFVERVKYIKKSKKARVPQRSATGSGAVQQTPEVESRVKKEKRTVTSVSALPDREETSNAILSDDNDNTLVEKPEVEPEPCESRGRRRGRGATVCYKEPSLGGKLRQGDKHTSGNKAKDDAKGKKKSRRTTKQRSVLGNIGNCLSGTE